METDPNRVRDLFMAAVALSPEGRARYLAEACGDSAEVRAEVERLLLADGEPDRLLEPPPRETTISFPAPELGTVIAGRYTLTKVIGEGGMGTVYRATQTEPVKRQVALKLIKSGMDSKMVLARFDAERQALAIMDHPHIARVYDGGSTAEGQPFFVMELVEGVPLTHYCDSRRMPVEERLRLFVSVCQAVQHAHQKGVIHRDLKPWNVLVTEVDGRPMPKIIDFGVAKAVEQKLTDLSFSDVGAIVGTPAYMSPEQADPDSMDIDTRADIYSLGIMLYELLTGSPPIDSSQFRRGAVLEVLRMVREVEPPRPSTKVSTVEALPSIAANRGVEPARLSRLMQGELDWVVMKAIEKDRARRYDTASGLARDIERYLADEMVEARPPSASYRLRKFVRRNRSQVLAGALVVAALLVGVVGTSIGMVQARRAAALEGLAKSEAEAARKVAEQSAQVAGSQATLALNSVQSLITQTNDRLQAPGLFEIRQALLETALANVDQVADVYDKAPSNKEATTAAALVSLGTIYRQLGQAQRAERQFEKALDITKARVVIKKGSDPSRRNLALVYSNLGATAEELDRDMDASLDYHKKALTLFEDIDEHPMLADSPLPRPMIRANLAEASKLVGVTYYRVGKLDEALPYYQKAYDLAVETAAAQPDDTNAQVTLTKSALALGATADRMGDRKKAEGFLAEARTRARDLLAAKPADPNVQVNWADVLLLSGLVHMNADERTEARDDLEGCAKVYEEVAAGDPRNVYDQRNVGKAQYNLGCLDLLESKADDARARFERALTIRETLAAIDPKNDRRRMDLMLAQAQTGRVDEAEATAERLVSRPKIDSELRVELARCYAIASRTLAGADRQRAESFGMRAMDQLRAAVKDGYRDWSYLGGEPDLRPLREREDFRALLEEIRTRAR
jgi:serine/threonine protein kinase